MKAGNKYDIPNGQELLTHFNNVFVSLQLLHLFPINDSHLGALPHDNSDLLLFLTNYSTLMFLTLVR